MTSWSQWRRGRFWVEIVLAALVGVAAFVVAAVVSTAARSHVPAVLLGLLLLLAILAVARFAGILYALPVGVVTIEAFDWYFLPPLRNLDGATVLVLGLFLGMAVIVGAVATQAGRRAAGSEQARGVLAAEQAALRRVATLVARQPSPAEVFAVVTEEAAGLLHLDSAHLIVYERDQTATVIGSCNLRGQPLPIGTRVPVEGDNIIGRVLRTQQPARIDDYSDARGLVAERVRSIGVRAAVGVPVLAGGRLWGVMAVGSSRPEPLPADTEMRIGAFTELVARRSRTPRRARSWSRSPRSKRRSAASRRSWPKPSRRVTSSQQSLLRSLGCSTSRWLGSSVTRGKAWRRLSPGRATCPLTSPAMALPGRRSGPRRLVAADGPTTQDR